MNFFVLIKIISVKKLPRNKFIKSFTKITKRLIFPGKEKKRKKMMEIMTTRLLMIPILKVTLRKLRKVTSIHPIIKEALPKS